MKTDKEVFEALKIIFPELTHIKYKGETTIQVWVNNGYHTWVSIGVKIKWSDENKIYPVSKKELKPCPWCGSKMLLWNKKYHHQSATDCIWDNMEFNKWPIVENSATEDSSEVEAPNTEDCLEVEKSYDPLLYCSEHSCNYYNQSMELHCGYSDDNSRCVKDVIPSLESLGIDPVEVWKEAPDWADKVVVTISLDRLFLAFAPNIGNIFKPFIKKIKLPPGVDWRNCWWGKPSVMPKNTKGEST